MNKIMWIAAAALLAACSGEDDKPLTREGFCESWAKAACSDEVVSACQAPSASECRTSQQAFCLGLVPENFAPRQASDCVRAVSAAYRDADLTGAELSVVLRLGEPCDAIIQGPKGIGESCTSTLNCDASEGLRCVKKGGDDMGSCQVPEEVSAGERCEAPQETCEEGFYCNGQNCIAAKDPGDSCASDEECGIANYCGSDSVCAVRLPVSSTCARDDECASGLCYAFNAGASTCVDRLRLSPSEPICADLR